MDALLMCGGEGTRLDADGEKPLFEVGGRPMIASVLDALGDSRIDSVTVVTSPATPRTRAYVEHRGRDAGDVPVRIVEAAGDGYVADLQHALSGVDRPVVTVVADLPLLDGAVLDDVIDRFAAGETGVSLTVCVPAPLKEALGASVDATLEGEERPLAPTGVNVVAEGDRERTTVSWDARLAVNVNRRSDAALAAALLREAIR